MRTSMSIQREIVFTKTPLRKTFRYRDEFQLMPYTSKVGPPITKYVVDYPCYLEYKIPDAYQNERRNFNLELNKDREICILLTAFSPYRFFTIDIHASSWGVKIPLWGGEAELLLMSENNCNLSKYEEIDILNQMSEYYYPCFYYPDKGLDLNINNFSEVEVEERMKLKKMYSYLGTHEQDRYDVRNDKAEVTLSEETVKCFDAYFALDEATKAKVFSAAFLISDSISLGDFKNSLSFLAAVAALETLADIANSDKEQVIEACKSCHAISSSPYKCPKCGRPIWGVTKKVKEFLKEYVSANDEDVANYNKIYNFRSKITHTGGIFLMDSVFRGSKEKRDLEFNLRHKLIGYARRAIINLLLKNQ